MLPLQTETIASICATALRLKEDRLIGYHLYNPRAPIHDSRRMPPSRLTASCLVLCCVDAVTRAPVIPLTP
jgi:hypothetical protein